METKYFVGMKYQTYIDDELCILRLINIKDNGKRYVLIDKDKNKVIMTAEQLNELVKLTPDALLNFFITYDSQFEADDVFVTVHPFNKKQDKPSLICRQNIYSPINDFVQSIDKVFIGGIFTDDNYTGRGNITSLLQYDKVKYTTSVISYIDDSIDDILACLGHNIKKFNHTLEIIYQEIKKNLPQATGMQTTLKEFMESQSFMYWYRLLFNINQLEFPINLGNNIDKDGNITLSNKQLSIIQDMLNADIKIEIILKYDRDIDLKDIVSYKHIIVCDSNNEIYLIAYTVINERIDDDIAKAMGLKK